MLGCGKITLVWSLLFVQNVTPPSLVPLVMDRSPTSLVNQNFADGFADSRSKENPPHPHPQPDAFAIDPEPQTGEEEGTIDEGSAVPLPVIEVDSVGENGNRRVEEEVGHYSSFVEEEEEEANDEWVVQPAVLSDEPAGKLCTWERSMLVGGAVLALSVRSIGVGME